MREPSIGEEAEKAQRAQRSRSTAQWNRCGFYFSAIYSFKAHAKGKFHESHPIPMSTTKPGLRPTGCYQLLMVNFMFRQNRRQRHRPSALGLFAFAKDSICGKRMPGLHGCHGTQKLQDKMKYWQKYTGE